MDLRYQAAHQGNERKWREGEEQNGTKGERPKITV